MRLSKLAGGVKPSATMAASAKAKEMKAAGVDVADFSVGEPDFPTPEHVRSAAAAAMNAGHTRYTPAPGVPELRRAIAAWYGKTYGLDCKPEEIAVSGGAKHAIHTALSCLLDPGDECVIPAPYWVSYSDLVRMTGAEPVLIPTSAESGFKLSPDQLKAALTPKTRLFMINSPCNPTGTVYTRGELAALMDVLADTAVVILSDEIYEQLIFDGLEPTCVATLRPWLRERTVTISGASKSYAMTGWRMGWTVAPAPLIKAMGAIQSQQTGSTCSVSQHAAIEALAGPQGCVAEMRSAFQGRRDYVCGRLAAMPGVTFPKPGGAFYVFADISAHLGRTLGGAAVTDSLSFCRAALEAAHVNVVPGAAFGQENFVRLSYAADRATLEAGLDRLERLLAG